MRFADSPERRRAELIGTGLALDDVIRESGAHVWTITSGKEVDGPVLRTGLFMTGAVCIWGVWPNAHPILAKDHAAPLRASIGIGSGTGASVKRISISNWSQSEGCAAGCEGLIVVPSASVRMTSLGSGLFGPWQPGLSSVAVGKASFVIPISTL